jgi:hypothetical protein
MGMRASFSALDCNVHIVEKQLCCELDITQ